MRNILFFFAALVMSASAFGREPDVVVRIENATTSAQTAPCTDKPCIPVQVDPIKLVPVGTGAAPNPNPDPSPAPVVLPKADGSAPGWLWPVLILALAGLAFLAWRNSQAQAERERCAREAAEKAAVEARERKAKQEAEERERERLRLVKAVEDANADFTRWRTAANEDRLRDALWRLAEFDGTIQCDPSGYTVSVPSGNLRVIRPFLAGGPQQVIVPPTDKPSKDEPPAKEPSVPPADKGREVPVDKPADKPADSKPDDKKGKGEDKPVVPIRSYRPMMSEGQERLLWRLLVDLGITDKEAQDRRLASELGPPDAVTREQAGACIERFKAELVAKRAADAEAAVKAAKATPKPNGDKPKGNGNGGGAAPAAPTQPAAGESKVDKPVVEPTRTEEPQVEPAPADKPAGGPATDASEGEKKHKGTKKVKGPEEPKTE